MGTGATLIAALLCKYSISFLDSSASPESPKDFYITRGVWNGEEGGRGGEGGKRGYKYIKASQATFPHTCMYLEPEVLHEVTG